MMYPSGSFLLLYGLLGIVLLASSYVNGDTTITSSPSRISPALFSAGDNITLTCSSTDSNTYTWTTTLTDASGNTLTLSDPILVGVFLHGYSTGTHTCTSGGNTASYILTVYGVSVWYKNPSPGGIIANNTAISVYSDINEIRCYSGDTSNSNTTLLGPAGISLLSFTPISPGLIRKSGETAINSITNGIYTCQYINESGHTQYVSFGVYGRDREPGAIGSSNTTSLDVQSVEYSTTQTSITVSCTSIGWPPTQVIWSQNNVVLNTGNNVTMTTRVIDRTLSIYKNELTVINAISGLGTYRCLVRTYRHNGALIGSALGSVTVQTAGSIMVAVTTTGSLDVGEAFILNCTVNKVDNDTLTVTWLRNNITVSTSNISNGVMLGALEEDSNAISKVLTLSPVRLSHIGQYSCEARKNTDIGRATINVEVDAPYIALSLDTSPDISVTLGDELTMTCNVYIPDAISGTVTSIEWYKNSTILITSGITNSLNEGISTLNMGRVLSVEGGNYTCIATISSPYIDTGLMTLTAANSTLLTVMLPVPSGVVFAFTDLSQPYYAGLDRELDCGLTLSLYSDPNVIVTMTITLNGSSDITSAPRRFLRNQQGGVSGDSVTYRRAIRFRHLLSSQDTGNYTCSITVTTNLISNYIVNSMGSKTSEYIILPAKPTVQLTSTAYRIPNAVGYNNISLNCTGFLTIPSYDYLSAPKVFTWSINNTMTTDSNPMSPYSASSISLMNIQEITEPGPVSVTCTVSISIPPDPIATTVSDISIIVTGPTVPLVPVNITAVNIRYNGATISWSVPSISYTPESYTVLYGTSIYNSSHIVYGRNDDFSTTNSVLTVELIDLIHDTVYNYTLRTNNSIGYTDSDVMTFRTREKPPTAPPDNFTLTVLNSTSISFQWDPPPFEHRNGLITQYTLTCYETVGGVDLLVTTPTFPRIINDSGSIILRGFRPGTFINCSLTSSNEAGTGPPAITNTTTLEQAPGGPPLGFTLRDITTHSINISWSPPDPSLQYGLIINYTLTCYEIDRQLVIFTNSYYIAPINITLDVFRPFTQYNCSVTAGNGAGFSPLASDVAMTDADAPGGPPQSFIIIPLNSTALTLQWRPVNEIEQNTLITNYTVTCNTSSNTPDRVYTDDVLEMANGLYSWIVSGLIPGTIHQCTVSANSLEGMSPPAISTGRTLEEAPSSSPVNITLMALNSHSLSLSFSPPLSPNGLIIQYSIYVYTTKLDVYNITGMEYRITGISPYQLVSVQVTGWTSIGEGPKSDSISERTHEDTPGPIQGIQYTAISSDVLLVNFTTSQPLSVARGIILEYAISIITYSGVGGSQIESVNASGDYVRVMFDNLLSYVPYNVSIIAINSAGEGVANTNIIFTEEGTPPSPKEITVDRISDTSMTVAWQPIPITEARGFILNYIITYLALSSSGDTKRESSLSVTVPANTSNVTITGLNTGVQYSVSVMGTTGRGEGVPSDPIIAQLPPTANEDSLPIIYIAVGALIGIILIIILIIIIIVVVVCVKQRSLSKGSATNGHLELPLDDLGGEKGAELKEYASINEEEPHPPYEAIKTPELIPMDERLKPIPRSAFSQHVREMHRERDKGFELEYQSLTTPTVMSHESAKLDVNRPKNRFANIYPYDFSRVVLSKLNNEEGTDYINASYMDGYNKSNTYIAAQGPLPNTSRDFWRMMWEHRLNTIVMLTKCIEAGKRKCEQYWPDKLNDNIETSDGISITLTSITPFADFEQKKFRIENSYNTKEEPLAVTHWHFLGWPDHGCPQYATSLISFIRQVHKHLDKSGPPVLVHCSAGVGRTGTYILLDSMLERLQVDDTINVYEFLRGMRNKRVFMVQTLAQYVFIHDALDELITCGETDVTVVKLKSKIATLKQGNPTSGFEGQFQLLDQVCRKPIDTDCSDALQSYNRPKNRYPDRVPYNLSRVRLRPTGAQGSEYINASFVDGYKQRNAYIATQGPLQATVHDFWKMIWEFKSRTIVLLSHEEENGVEVCYPYWPAKVGEPLQFNKLIVTLQSEVEKLGGYVVRKLELKEDRPQPVSFQVTQFQFKEWEEHKVPSTCPGLLTMLEDINKVQRNTGNKAITVMCNDGQSRTGSFICIHAQQDRLKTEAVVDIFHYIKSIRIQRSRMVPEIEQYKFCHQILQEYYEKFNVYSNFK